MERSYRRAATLVGAMLAAASLAGCGQSSHRKTFTAKVTVLHVDSSALAEPGGSDQTGGVIAQVGGVPITRSAFNNRLAIELRGESPGRRELPKAPRYEACIAHLAALAGRGAEKPPSKTQLKHLCQARHDAIVSEVLEPLISANWAFGEVAAEHLALSEQEVRRRLEHLEAVQFGSSAKLQAFFSQTGENTPDLLFNVKLELADQLIFNKIHASLPPVTRAVVSAYYANHAKQYEVAEQRDIGIVRINNRAHAIKAKRELEHGTSFAAMAKQQSSQQPAFSVDGLVQRLEPNLYAEPELNDAIFSARPRTVGGPIAVNYPDIRGYYLFSVYSVHPHHHKSLAQVQASITAQLPGELYKQAVADFAKRYRAKWIAQTSCTPGFIVRKCRQFESSPGETQEDPYNIR